MIMPFTAPDKTLPSFPSGLRETQLARIPLSALQSNDAAAVDLLFNVCQSQGFFYLDLESSPPLGHSLLSSASALQELSEQAFKLPLETKQSVHQSVTNTLFGWKSSGAIAAADPYKRSDVGEFWNISKDDILSVPCARPPIPYPPLLSENTALFSTFIHDAHSVGLLILTRLASKLSIPAEEITSRHRISRPSGDHIRLTWGPSSPSPLPSLNDQPEKDIKITTYGHTDFGSITLLFNWLGGLQIAHRNDPNSNEEEWEYVRPLKDHAIINLGDAAVVFSGARLASGKHRVVTAPGLQAVQDRYSVVYFVRPGDDVCMESLMPSSDSGKLISGSEDGGCGNVSESYVGGRERNIDAENEGIQALFNTNTNNHSNSNTNSNNNQESEGKVITAAEWIRARALALGNMAPQK